MSREQKYYAVDGNTYDTEHEAIKANREYWNSKEKSESFINAINKIYYKSDKSSESYKKLNEILLDVIDYIGKQKITFNSYQNYYNLFLNLSMMYEPSVDCLNDFAIALCIAKIYPSSPADMERYEECKTKLSDYINDYLTKSKGNI